MGRHGGKGVPLGVLDKLRVAFGPNDEWAPAEAAHVVLGMAVKGYAHAAAIEVATDEHVKICRVVTKGRNGLTFTGL